MKNPIKAQRAADPARARRRAARSPAAATTTTPRRHHDRACRTRCKNIVVIYAENRGFDNLFGNFPGANGLAPWSTPTGKPTAAYVPQKDRDGTPCSPTLPQTWGGVTAAGAAPVSHAGAERRPAERAVRDRDRVHRVGGIVDADTTSSRATSTTASSRTRCRSTAARTTCSPRGPTPAA